MYILTCAICNLIRVSSAISYSSCRDIISVTLLHIYFWSYGRGGCKGRLRLPQTWYHAIGIRNCLHERDLYQENCWQIKFRWLGYQGGRGLFRGSSRECGFHRVRLFWIILPWNYLTHSAPTASCLLLWRVVNAVARHGIERARV